MPQSLLQRNDALPDSRNGVTTIGTGFLNCCCSSWLSDGKRSKKSPELLTQATNTSNGVRARIHVGFMEII